MKYGMPYMGSKSKIADEILALIPDADFFVDVFAGGCAMTDAALLSNRFKGIISNDMKGTPAVYESFIKGKKPSYAWVSREDFHRLKSNDLVIAMCWSFGNNLGSYAYGKHKEDMLRKVWTAIVDRSESGAEAYQKYKEYKKRLKAIERRMDVTSIERLQSLEHLQSLERLQSLELDYTDLEIPENAVIYCDPPYKGTNGYQCGFDHEKFYDWCEKQTAPVFISEYWMPEERFKCVWSKPLRTSMCSTSNNIKRVEKLWVPNKDYSKHLERMKKHA